MTHAIIAGIGAYLPQRVLTNADLEKMVETSDEWIVTRTGVRERRIAAEGERTSDLAAAAGISALADAGLRPGDVDLLIVGTSSADYSLPSAAAVAAATMGLDCPAYDLNAACTGFIYSLHAGATAIESGRARTVLVIGADALSRFVDWEDRATCVLFGDGAGAVVLSAADEPGVLGIHLGSDGSGADMIIRPTGGALDNCSAEGLAARGQYLKMSGSEVFKFAVRAIPKATRQALKESHLSVEDVTWLVPHQANQRILDTVADRLGMDHERVVSTVAQHGNTSAASIPLALHALYTGGDLRPGDILAFVGFGAGLTWGAAVVRWTKKG
ncbi:MAG TPA: beta-ketoacyl-ACP synthase III [Coriobacteriia bacterium]